MEHDKNIEKLAEIVHDAWWRTKQLQGFHSPKACPRFGGEKFQPHCPECHVDMYPYDELPEHVKEYDRTTVRAVCSAIDTLKEKNAREKTNPTP